MLLKLVTMCASLMSPLNGGAPRTAHATPHIWSYRYDTYPVFIGIHSHAATSPIIGMIGMLLKLVTTCAGLITWWCCSSGRSSCHHMSDHTNTPAAFPGTPSHAFWYRHDHPTLQDAALPASPTQSSPPLSHLSGKTRALLNPRHQLSGDPLYFIKNMILNKGRIFPPPTRTRTEEQLLPLNIPFALFSLPPSGSSASIGPMGECHEEALSNGEPA